MIRPVVLLAAVGVLTAGCGSSSTPTNPTTPGTTTVVFSAQLLPANETPPVSNADSSGGGTATITLHVTKDSSGVVTSATADFSVTLAGFPAGTTLTGAHIHEGAVGVSGSIKVSAGLTTGEVVLASGAGSFTKTGINVTADVAQGMMSNPAGYYFNVHTSLSPAGAARGQLAITG